MVEVDPNFSAMISDALTSELKAQRDGALGRCLQLAAELAAARNAIIGRENALIRLDEENKSLRERLGEPPEIQITPH